MFRWLMDWFTFPAEKNVFYPGIRESGDYVCVNCRGRLAQGDDTWVSAGCSRDCNHEWITSKEDDIYWENLRKNMKEYKFKRLKF